MVAWWVISGTDVVHPISTQKRVARRAPRYADVPPNNPSAILSCPRIPFMHHRHTRRRRHRIALLFFIGLRVAGNRLVVLLLLTFLACRLFGSRWWCYDESDVYAGKPMLLFNTHTHTGERLPAPCGSRARVVGLGLPNLCIASGTVQPAPRWGGHTNAAGAQGAVTLMLGRSHFC
jgi:hypothetical protein